MSRSSIWLCRYLLPSFDVLALPEKAVGVFFSGGDASLGRSSAALSRETVVASLETELRTLAADDVVDETASIEARLCFEVVRRSMLSGRDTAPCPGLRVLLLAEAEAEADPDA
jgi:hypothetical protein